MKNWSFLLIIIGLALLQTTILDCINIFNVKPDLLFLSVFAASISLEPMRAVALSIFAGILKDVLSLNAFGINTLLFPLISLVIIRLSKEISLDNNLICALAVFIIMFINDVINRSIFLFLGNFIPWGIFLRTTFLESFYTAFVLLLVFNVFKASVFRS